MVSNDSGTILKKFHIDHLAKNGHHWHMLNAHGDILCLMANTLYDTVTE